MFLLGRLNPFQPGMRFASNVAIERISDLILLITEGADYLFIFMVL